MAIKKRTLIKALLLSVIILAVLLTSAWFFVSYQISHLDNFKDAITTAAGRTLQRDVTYENGQATLTVHNGLVVQFTNIVIREKDRSSDFLIIPTVFLRVKILPLLRNRLILREVILDQPQLFLKRDRSGVLNIADIFVGEKKREIELRKITIEKGLLTFLDEAAGAKNLITSLTDLSCRIDKSRWSKKSTFRITANVTEEKNRGKLELNGTFRAAPEAKPLMESTVDVSLRLKGMDVHHYRPYLDRLPLKQLAGYLDVEATFSGTLSNFQSKGTVFLRDALIDYPQVFRGPLQPQAVHVDYTLKRNKGDLQLDVARLAIDRLTAAGRFSIREMGQADPVLAATAVTSTFLLKDARPYIPWGIIPKDVENFIEAHIKDGNFRLVEAKLSGRKSQIVGMERPENAGVLSIRAEVNKGVFVVNNKTPVFQDISGALELKKREFSLKNMKGLFGSSPCSLEGSISDFALPQPNVYTAEMTIQPAREEVLWLVGKEKFRNIGFQGLSTLRLSGKGPVDNYRIGTIWDLTAAQYAYPEVLEKPSSKQNGLTCDIVLNKDAVTVSSFRYDLPRITVTGSARYNFTGKHPLSVNVRSNVVAIHEAAAMLPVLKPYDPAGTCLINVAGNGDPNDPGSFSWEGNVSLTDVSLKLPDNIKPIRGLTGKITFRGKRVETSQLNARIGDSVIAGKCAIDNIGNPQVTCQFTAPLFQTADVGWQSPEGPVNFQNVKGRVSVNDNLIHVDGLALQLGKSRFNVSGNIREFSHPKITLLLNSPYIDADDIARLMTLRYSKGEDEASSKMKLAATVQADAGEVHGAAFHRLHSQLNFAGKTLNINTLETGIFDGKITGKGKVDLSPDGLNRYAASFSVDKISLDKTQGALKMGGRKITGNLSLTGDITTIGRNADNLKKTLAGTLRVRAEKGVLKQFPVLSKIFSLLNVFQLAKFHLPDMARGGMPYKTITGNLTVRDGVFSSEDFFIDSDAMQISIVGKVDLFKEEYNNIIGVHPLGTLDKIVSKIPIAGWLLTDERGNLFIVHFKVDGKWDNPNVTPIPVQSIAEGTLDIFRRLFQLPKKLVTDTGEVILGH